MEVVATPESMNDKQFYVTCPAHRIVTALHNILQDEITYVRGECR